MLKRFFKTIYRFFSPISDKGSENRFINKSKIGNCFNVSIDGNENIIEIGSNCVLTNSSIYISGNNNKLIIHDKVRFLGPCKIFLSGNAELVIGYNSGIRGVEFNVRNANIKIGELCMFSYGIVLRNHDSHRIIDPETQNVLNSPKDIILGDHVWIGQNATILKGSIIGNNSVIGFGAIVTCSCNPGSVLAGVPAKVVKENINWDY